MDEVECWKIRWALVISHVGVIGNKREIFQCNETREILLKVDYERLCHLCIYTGLHVQVDLVDLILIFGVLMPLSTIFQLYHGDQF